MSFILDALKKSEHERQRQASPGLVESSIALPRPRLPRWAIAMCALLAINLAVLTFVLTRGWRGAEPPAATTRPAARLKEGAAEDTADGAQATVDPQFSPLSTAPEYAPEIPVTPVPPLVTAPPVATPSPASITRPQASSGSSSPHAPRRQDPLLNEGDYKPVDEETLPSINELNLTGAQALPEMHLDVHVFATRSTDRFVFINMRKYHEGARLQEGPTVERIRRDGVILDYQGLRFLLPRQ